MASLRREKQAMQAKDSQEDGEPAQGVHLQAHPILTQEQESRIVAELGALRRRIETLIAPRIAKAPLTAKLDHFDQKIAYFTEHVAAGPPNKPRDALLAKYRTLKQRLALANLAWVTKLAHSQRSVSIAHEDLFQEGVCGLLKAIDRFEPERGLRLMTYATWYIREAMQQIRARQTHLVAISSHDHTLANKIEVARAALQSRERQRPSFQEIGTLVNRNPVTIGRLQAATAATASLERCGFVGPMAVASADPVKEYDRLDAIRHVASRLVEGLPDRERIIVTRRFGLDGRDPDSLEALGDHLKVSKERIRQLQRQAIRRMQERAAKESLESVGA